MHSGARDGRSKFFFRREWIIDSINREASGTSLPDIRYAVGLSSSMKKNESRRIQNTQQQGRQKPKTQQHGDRGALPVRRRIVRYQVSGSRIRSGTAQHTMLRLIISYAKLK